MHETVQSKLDIQIVYIEDGYKTGYYSISIGGHRYSSKADVLQGMESIIATLSSDFKILRSKEFDGITLFVDGEKQPE